MKIQSERNLVYEHKFWVRTIREIFSGYCLQFSEFLFSVDLQPSCHVYTAQVRSKFHAFIGLIISIYWESSMMEIPWASVNFWSKCSEIFTFLFLFALWPVPYWVPWQPRNESDQNVPVTFDDIMRYCSLASRILVRFGYFGSCDVTFHLLISFSRPNHGFLDGRFIRTALTVALGNFLKYAYMCIRLYAYSLMWVQSEEHFIHYLGLSVHAWLRVPCHIKWQH